MRVNRIYKQRDASNSYLCFLLFIDNLLQNVLNKFNRVLLARLNKLVRGQFLLFLIIVKKGVFH